MKIVLAENAGFCWGVKRAVDIAVDAAKKGKVFCLGELIHNGREINKLKRMGIKFINSVNSLKNGDNIIIRSHGVSPKVMNALKDRGLNIIDATCPFVKDVHEKVVELKAAGYPVLILGNPKHPEVIGIAGHVDKPMVIDSIEKLESLEKHRRLGVVCQTTLNVDFFRKAISVLAFKVKELKVFNTICSTTLIRQREAKNLALKVNLMFVIGGKNSSNTTKLYQISKRVNPNSFHIESRDDIDASLLRNVQSVGITAGASTPKWVINEVVDYIKGLKGGG